MVVERPGGEVILNDLIGCPGTDSDLNAYDALFYAGDANSGSKTRKAAIVA